MANSGTNNETVHISLGNTANHITSHLLNLQGLAATASSSSQNYTGNGSDNGASAALCDPSVTHDIASLDSEYYSSYNTSSTSRGGYVYVPRCLIVDGRDSFGSSWGGVSSRSTSSSRNAAAAEHENNHQVSSWNGAVSMFDPSDHSIFGDDQNNDKKDDNDSRQPPCNDGRNNNNDAAGDPLDQFRNAASVMGLSPLYSRFNAAPPATTYSSYNVGAGDSSRHVQWDDDEEEEEEEDEYCYGQNMERVQEEKQRQLEKMEYQKQEARRGHNSLMEEVWENAFYGGRRGDADDGSEQDVTKGGTSNNSNDANDATNNGTTTNDSTPNPTHEQRGPSARDIQWHDYWMPPKPSPSKYQVPLPFDTHGNNAARDNNNPSTWSTSFNMGYQPGGGMGGSESAGTTQSWREHALSESLRKVLERCDVVKGFNVFVDGGTVATGGGGNGNTVQGPNDITAGGGFHAGLAASLLEELSEECRSAGRFAVMVDPPSVNDYSSDNLEARGNRMQQNFRRRLNAGLALHGLSSNADVFLPVSVDGAYRALRGGKNQPSPPQNNNDNRRLFEGSAAISLALEAATLSYRLRNHYRSSRRDVATPRSRIGIQSGYYQGYSGNSDDADSNEPYATAPSLTYREFLACARPSSDRRRSVLELDALLHPLSYPPAGGGGGGGGGQVGVGGGSMPPSMLASLVSAGLIGNINNSNMGGELEKRMIRGTSIERMRMEQQRQQYRSSRGGNSRSLRQDQEPGGWLEDSVGGGLLSSLSGNSVPFGRRADHHHFALSTSLRPAASDVRGSSSASTALLRPMMESMGVKYRPEVSLGLVANDTAVDLTSNVGSYWKTIFADRRNVNASTTSTTPVAGTASGSGDGGNNLPNQQPPKSNLAPHTPIVSVLGNSTRSYPRLHSVSSGFIDVLQSRCNMGYFSRDVMAGVIPEKDDCAEALEYCQELVDVYEPPMGSGLVGEDDNDDVDAFFDEEEN